MRKIQIITGTLCLMLLCGCASGKNDDKTPDNAAQSESVVEEMTEDSSSDTSTSPYSSVSISKEPLTPLLGESHSHPDKKHYETLAYDWEKTSFRRTSDGQKEYAHVVYKDKELSLVVTPDSPAWFEIGNDFIDYGFLGVAENGEQYYISLYTQSGEDGASTNTDIMIAKITDQLPTTD